MTSGWRFFSVVVLLVVVRHLSISSAAHRAARSSGSIFHLNATFHYSGEEKGFFVSLVENLNAPLADWMRVMCDGKGSSVVFFFFCENGVYLLLWKISSMKI